MRVERFRNTTVKTVRKNNPWAPHVVKRGDVVFAFHSYDDVPDLAPVSNLGKEIMPIRDSDFGGWFAKGFGSREKG